MTEKAQRILNDFRRKDRAKKTLKLFRTPKARSQTLEQFNRDNMDDVGPIIAQDQRMRVLDEMNELGEHEEQAFQDGVAKINSC